MWVVNQFRLNPTNNLIKEREKKSCSVKAAWQYHLNRIITSWKENIVKRKALQAVMENSSNLLQLPVEVRRSSSVSFRIDDAREDMFGRRPTIVSIISQLSSRNSRLSMASITTREFKQTIKGMGVLVLVTFVLVIFVIVFYCLDHVLNVVYG